jgi:hypothetical protein
MRLVSVLARSAKIAVVGTSLALSGVGAIALADHMEGPSVQLVRYDGHRHGSVKAMWVTIENRHAARSNGHVVRIFPTVPGSGAREIAVTFDRDVTRCAIQATPGFSNGILTAGLTISATGALGVPQVPEVDQPRTVIVSEFGRKVQTVESGMHVLVVC